MSNEKLFLGLDVGSVSVGIAVLAANGGVIRQSYRRHKGRPVHTALEMLREFRGERGADGVACIAATGTGGRLVGEAVGALFVNEVIAQARATRFLAPTVRTVIEIGGEDSKLIFMPDPCSDADGTVADFAMNTVCAAGTGSFLDQQAARLGLTIEEFGALALESDSPPRVAGRCSVFAKSDMIHLQQKGTPVKDIVAGLCYALARNFKSTVGAARVFERPIAFQGGVAANKGIARALEDVLGLRHGDLVIPEYYGVTGAIGAALHAMQEEKLPAPDWGGLSVLEARMSAGESAEGRLEPLGLEQSRVLRTDRVEPVKVAAGRKVPAYLGVDIGSISTNVVVLDAEGRVLAKRYLMTAGRPIEAVRQGLYEVGQELGDAVEILGACTTGSGRYLIADLIGADVVRNEITAQATGAYTIDPEVDTIFEIGGQDSKYISLENGAIVDFEMNKVCAAGTGSFLEEQAEKLGISIKGEFGDLAMKSRAPIDLGERCTVFMETELVRHQQAGAATEDLVAGLSYSIVYNYLNRVVQGRRIGRRIFFQGGTAANQGVVAAFETVTGRPITVPPHHEVTGAIGCAIIARQEHPDGPSAFKGFDLTQRSYEISSFECKECANLCEINRVTVEGERPLFYGSRCEKFDVDRRRKREAVSADPFAERAELLLSAHRTSRAPAPDAPRVGVPRALLFHDLYPLWHGFLAELGMNIVLSDPTSKKIIHAGAEQSVAETCFPMKVALGHVLDLLDKGIDYLFVPSVINLPKSDPRMTDSFVCPYVQSLCYTVRSAAPLAERGVKVLDPPIYLQLGRRQITSALVALGGELGRSSAEIRRAVDAGLAALARFHDGVRSHGREFLAGLGPDERALVIVGRSYNGCDLGANLEIPRKLRDIGIKAIPMDFLPIDEVELPSEWQNMYWRYGQRILAAAEIIARDERLFPVYITNFGCGPDSFIHQYFRERLGGKPCLIIEVDEHSADAGMMTRCEAFLESIKNADGRAGEGRRFMPVNIKPGERRTVLVPNMSTHAYAVAAALRASGLPAEVLPEPDEETLFWGRQFTSGKECFPCIVTTGDMVKFVKRPDFDRTKYAFFMGGSGGPCRFGQYNALQRMVLDQLGYDDVPIFAPNQASSFYDDCGIAGRRLLQEAWRGIVCMDVLLKATRETRPYELDGGLTNKIQWECVHDVSETIASGGSFVEAMRRCRRRFDSITVDKSCPRPVIGLVGEFYVRESAFSNQDIVAKIEALGGEVWAAPAYEWFLYRNLRRGMRAWLGRDLKLWGKNKIKDHFQKRDEHAIVETFDGFLRNLHEPRTEDVLDIAAPYVHRSFEGEAILTVGKALDFALKGLAGIVSVMPFTCMPGTVSHAIMKRVREDHGGFPFLNMVYDGLEQATSVTRLEAFMHQTRERHRRMMASIVA